ncbi:hypothetical protein ACIOWI_07855 [Streptomyces sp. NPDC087659]|jgi:pilus assembly protein Flp/PilA|uniref:Pilus assembly protein Flp/PilA n=1 Tax=Streptomyces wuyuanensis TaxID=1196353 RepID=A0A1G9P0R0_9ACTN|nr:hypothetical protein [Streptomyces wuyuanensis]SDL91827.1 pilus assembly protein Flp/PilA [Streptomyces wuyuanensis]
MSNITLKAATNARVYVGSWAKTTVEAIQRRGDKGQGAVEYVGVIVLVALIIAALVGSGVADTIATGLTTKVGEILGG